MSIIRRVFAVFDFERPNIEVVEISEDKKYGKFVVEPLERGYGRPVRYSVPRSSFWLRMALITCRYRNR